MKLSKLRRMLDKIMDVQSKFPKKQIQPFMDDGEGRCSLLRVVGREGEKVLLQVKNGRLQYAPVGAKHIHVFVTTYDVFLDLLLGDIDMRQAITKQLFIIENAKTQSIDLLECEKWSSAFNDLGAMIGKVIRW